IVAHWQCCSTPPRCLHPMFDSKQCQRCSTPSSCRIGTFLHAERCESCHGESYVCMAQLYIVFFTTAETCFNFHSVVEYGDDGATLVAEHRTPGVTASSFST
ncbi:hypothetical protein ALC62_03573, partial [Cyphomyrmex costatus]